MTIREYRHQFPTATPAEIVAMRAAEPPVTAQPIRLDALAPYLRKYGIMAAIKVIVAKDETIDLVKVGLNDFLDQVADVRATTLDTTDPIIAGRAAALLGFLVSVSVATPANQDAIYAMGDGLALPPITEADVAADIAAEQAEIEAAQFAVQKRALGEQISADWNLRSNTLDAATSLADLPTLEQLRAVTA